MTSNSFSSVLILFLSRAICADIEGDGDEEVEDGGENVEENGEGGDGDDAGSSSTLINKEEGGVGKESCPSMFWLSKRSCCEGWVKS